MARYYKDEDAMIFINLTINADKYLYDLIPKIIEVVEKFDSKVSGKRLDTALKQIDKSLAFKKDGNFWRIVHYLHNNRMAMDSTNTSAIYLDTPEDLVSVLIESAEDSGKINASKVIYELVLKQESLLKEIQELEEQLKNIEQLKQEYNKIKQELDNFRSKTNYVIRDCFNLKTELR